MAIRLTYALAAAALVLSQSNQAYAKDTYKVPKEPISLTGCIQRESDYRRQHDLGKGGFLGFGGGLGNEYVLVHASPSRRGFADCSGAYGGEAYELTGHGEGDLKPFVGQRVTVTGMRKSARVDAVTGYPTGGRQIGSDLRLFEVNVDSFSPAPVQPRRIARVDENAAQLPASASPLPLIGLLGLLSLAAGLTLRVTRWAW